MASSHPSQSTFEEKIDIMTDHLGHLTAGLTEFRLDLAERKATVREQTQIAKDQSASIDRLSRLAERQAETGDRLAVAVETFLLHAGGTRSWLPRI